MSANRNVLLLSLAAALSLTATATAQQPSTGLAGDPVKRVTLPEATAPDSTEVLTLTVNKSYMLEFDAVVLKSAVLQPALLEQIGLKSTIGFDNTKNYFLREAMTRA